MSIIPQQPRTPAGQPDSSALLTELQSEVSVEAAPLLQFIVRHAGVIVTVLVLFVIALAGTGGYNWYSARAAAKAQAELTAVVLGTQGADRVAALEKFVEGAPSSIRTAAWLALGDAAAAQQNFALAGKAFGQVAADDSNGAMGLLAGLNQGQALLRAGEGAKALTILEKVENLMPEIQRSMVRQLVAEAAIQAGDTAKARTIFEALAASATGGEAEFFRYRARSLAAPATPAAPAAGDKVAPAAPKGQ